MPFCFVSLYVCCLFVCLFYVYLSINLHGCTVLTKLFYLFTWSTLEKGRKLALLVVVEQPYITHSYGFAFYNKKHVKYKVSNDINRILPVLNPKIIPTKRIWNDWMRNFTILIMAFDAILFCIVMCLLLVFFLCISVINLVLLYWQNFQVIHPVKNKEISLMIVEQPNKIHIKY